MGFVEGDTLLADQYFKANRFHLIVGDLPYGIVHSHNSKKAQIQASRNPKGLLEAALHGWKIVLKTGGLMVIAWNTFLIKREKMEEIFEKEGLEIIKPDSYGNIVHMVDRSIKRDILIVKKND